MRKEDARDTARQALDAFVKAFGAEHPSTLKAAPLLRQIVAGGTVALHANANVASVVVSQMRQGQAALEARSPRRAADLLAEAAYGASNAGMLALEASARGMLAQAMFMLGRRSEALANVRSALAITEQIGQEDAVRHFRQLLRRIESAGPLPVVPAGPDWNTRIQAALEQAQAGDLDVACRALVQIAEQAHDAGAQQPEANARIFLGQMLISRGERELAKAELLRALGIAESVGDGTAAGHARALLRQV